MGDRSASEGLEMKNKAQMFTLFAIILLALIFVSFEIYTVMYERESIRTRVSTMNSFLYSVEQNLERQLYIIGFRIILLAENEIATTGSPINVADFFNESFFKFRISDSICASSSLSLRISAFLSD